MEEELIEEEASDVRQGSVMECCLGEVKRGASPTTFREESLRIWSKIRSHCMIEIVLSAQHFTLQPDQIAQRRSRSWSMLVLM